VYIDQISLVFISEHQSGRGPERVPHCSNWSFRYSSRNT